MSYLIKLDYKGNVLKCSPYPFKGQTTIVDEDAYHLVMKYIEKPQSRPRRYRKLKGFMAIYKRVKSDLKRNNELKQNGEDSLYF